MNKTIEYLKSLLIIFLVYFFSMFVVGYLQDFYLIRVITAFINSMGISPKTVEEFLFGWAIIILPNIFCGMLIGKYVPLKHQLFISPFIIILFHRVSSYMYWRSNSFIWLCDSWNLLFVTAIIGIVVKFKYKNKAI